MSETPSLPALACASAVKSTPLLAAALIPLPSGCLSMGPDFKSPDWDGSDAWKTAVTNAPVASPLPDGASWWSVFKDPVLDSLEAELLAQNPSLDAAIARLDAAAAQLGMARAARAPSVDVGASAAYDRQTGETHGSSKFPDNPAWLYQPGASFSWELDFWGRVRRTGEAVVEMVGTIHHGENRGDKTVVLDMHYVSQPGTPLAVQHPEITK